MDQNIYHIEKNNANQIIWKENQEKEIIRLYQNGNSLVDICNIFNISAPDTIRRVLKRNNIPVIGFRSKYPVNEDYFEDINTKEKAYWLGVLYADGAINKNNSVRLGMKDKDHIEKFKKAIGAINHKIGVTIDKRFTHESECYYISIKSKKMHDDLIKQGCTEKKSLTIDKIPNIKKEFISHFIRGYFDGDGSLHSTFIKGDKIYRISFVGTFNFLSDIQEKIHIKKKIVQNGGNNNKSYVFQICSQKDVLEVLNYLYQDATIKEVLDRKYDKYLEMCSYLGASPLNLEN